MSSRSCHGLVTVLSHVVRVRQALVAALWPERLLVLGFSALRGEPAPVTLGEGARPDPAGASPAHPGKKVSKYLELRSVWSGHLPKPESPDGDAPEEAFPRLAPLGWAPLRWAPGRAVHGKLRRALPERLCSGQRGAADGAAQWIGCGTGGLGKGHLHTCTTCVHLHHLPCLHWQAAVAEVQKKHAEPVEAGQHLDLGPPTSPWPSEYQVLSP